MAPELEVLDQLLGGDMPLNVLSKLFPSELHCIRALSQMLEAGEVVLTDAGGKAVPHWRFQELGRSGVLGATAATIRASVTEVGAKRVA